MFEVMAGQSPPTLFHANHDPHVQNKPFCNKFNDVALKKKMSKPEVVENARAPRKMVENGFWSFKPFMDFARAPRKMIENRVENGSGVLKPNTLSLLQRAKTDSFSTEMCVRAAKPDFVLYRFFAPFP